jgi:hypothetical protein
MKQTTRKKAVKVFSDLKSSLHEALAYEQGEKEHCGLPMYPRQSGLGPCLSLVNELRRYTRV